MVIAQKGAREHFLAARALHGQKRLAQLVVDWYAPRGVLKVACWPLGRNGTSALASRAEGIPDHLVCPMRLLGLWSKWQERGASQRGRPYEGYDKTDVAFACAVARQQLPEHEGFFGYSYASLEALEAEKGRGHLTIVDQIDPGPVEFRLVAEEMAKRPELAGPPEPFPETHYARARLEWDLADVIVVNSEWTREAIVAEGADPAKIEILPLAYETDRRTEDGDQRSEVSGRWSSGLLKVLWLGQVNVRKGIHYLLEAARMLEKEPVEFVVAGPLGIRREVVAAAAKNIRWLGAVPRNQASELYRRSDVFVLPTLSDGFAITQIEALAHGLPVIVTPNCGWVVEEGKTGFLIPARDSQALTEAIMRFIRNPVLAAEMSSRCVEASKAFSIDAYGQKLVQIIEAHMVRKDTEAGRRKAEAR